MKKKVIKIGLLGGTFNPPHIGHLYIAKKIYEEFHLDKILFIPVGDPPHKTDKFIASSEDRINMINLMINDYPYMDITDIEINRPGYTYTIDTISKLINENKNTEYYYIIGSDTLFQLTNWKNFEEVFSLITFICIPRPGDDNEKIINRISYLDEKYSAKILLSNNKGPDISSTAIRSAIDGNHSNKNDLLDKKVLEYILEKNVFNGQ